MRQIQLTRKAIKNLQKLQSSGALKTPERLLNPLAATAAADKFPHTIHLDGRGHSHLWRSRVDLGGGSSLRFIWSQSQEDGSIRLLYVAKRDDDTYGFNLGGLPEEPAYLWNGESGVDWSLFLNGAYNASPILTRSQRSASTQIGEHHHSSHDVDERIGFHAHITQSSPGTGKTITAALRACELYTAGWNVAFLLPQHLLKEVRSFRCIQSMPADPKQGFFYGTFLDWIAVSCPEIADQSLSPTAARDILNELASGIRRSDQHANLKGHLKDIEQRDVVLYEAFVIGASKHSKNSVYRNNKDRIKALRRIKPEWWKVEFDQRGKQSRTGIAKAVRDEWQEGSTTFEISHFKAEGRIGNVLIVDEAQDYLLSEIEALKSLCKHLHTVGGPTHLWLLGDLNQRITPVDFDWGDLELTKRKMLEKKSFRNSKHILTFSNLLLSPVEASSHEQGSRHPQTAANPDHAYEVGELVKLLVCSDISEAERFLSQLSQSVGTYQNNIQAERSLAYILANRIKILITEAYESRHGDELDFLNVHQVKGREFDTCIAFNVFEHAGDRPISENWRQWYTLLTRTRSRLLVIVTQEQRTLLETHVPAILLNCDLIDDPDSNVLHSLCQWIQAEHNDVEFSTDQKNIVKRYLISALQGDSLVIYTDTYEMLDQVGIEGEERTALEKAMMRQLRKYPAELIEPELERATRTAKTPLLTSLLFRAMDRYWKGTQVISVLKDSHPNEYRRVVEATADRLKASGLPVEAARLRHQRLGAPYPQDFPFPQAAQTEGRLVDVLINMLSDHFKIKLGEP